MILKKYFLFLYLLFFFSISISNDSLFAQALPIFVDGTFEDWKTSDVVEDVEGDAFGIDFLDLSVSHDADFVFVRVRTSKEMQLTEGNSIQLLIDTDNDVNTGTSSGTDLTVYLGNRSAVAKINGSSVNVSLNRLAFYSLPTFSSTEHELAIGRDVKVSGQSLFAHPTIRLSLRNGSTGDRIPDAEEGGMLSYTFDDADNPPAIEPINLDKKSVKDLRIMTYNVLQDGLIDPLRVERFERILQAAEPDIVTFNECWSAGPLEVRQFMNRALPLDTDYGWYGIKRDQGNITVARFPILDSWEVLSQKRLTAVLFDLPDAVYATDILVVNAHFKCCGGNSEDAKRQREADSFASFILDARTLGGDIDLPLNTPFLLSGDLNLVGDSQPFKTAVTGNIIGTSEFGQGAALDWDGTDLLDVISPQTEQRLAFTWRNINSSFTPSRLDYMICANSVMQVQNAYTLATESMSPENLAAYNLKATDTQVASDHLPKITDFALSLVTDVSNVVNEELANIELRPNPFARQQHILISLPSFDADTQNIRLELFDIWGRLVWKHTTLNNISPSELSVDLDGGNLVDGVYFLRVVGNNGELLGVERVVKTGR